MLKFSSRSVRNNAVCVTRLKVNKRRSYRLLRRGYSIASLPTGDNIKDNHAVTDLL